MSDSKYAGLPGIDDQPDLFETSDLPEADQRSSRFVTTDLSESVTVVPVSARDAFGHFSSRSEPPRGTGTGEEIDPSKSSDETILERYHRLQRETSEVVSLVNQLKGVSGQKSEGSQDFGARLDPQQMLSSVESLTGELNRLQLDSWLSLGQLQSADSKQEEIKKVIDEVKKASSDPATGEGVVYEFYCKPERRALDQQARLASLDERMARLESVLRHDDRKLSLLRGVDSVQDKSLLECVHDLQGRVSALSAHNLEAIDARLTSLLHKLNQISDRRGHAAAGAGSGAESAERLRKIDELYEAFVATEYPNLALVLSRLTTLAQLHQKAREFSDGLTHISSIQTDLAESMKDNGDQLTALRATMDSNLAAMQDLVGQMQSRMEALKKK